MTIQEFIDAIKGMSVLELNERVKACDEEFGVSAAAGVVVAAAGPAAAAEEEKTEFDVELTDFGAHKGELFAGVSVHIGDKRPQPCKAVAVVAGHFA